jgi:translation initiation factor 6
MTLIRADVFGSPNIGVYCFCNNKMLITPPGLPRRKIERFEKNLSVRVCQTSIGGSSLLGVLLSANSNGIVAPRTLRDYELEALRSSTDLRVEIIKDPWTAFGNLILANDYGAIVHPGMRRPSIRKISDVLGVEVVTGQICGLPYIGALAVATNKGVIAHPSILDDEKKKIEEVLRVPVDVGTINGGVPFVKSGLIVNDCGAIVGSLTNGSEMMQLTRIFGI